VKVRLLGGVAVSELGFGCMGLSDMRGGRVDDGDGIAIVRRALELGITLLDTADVYGCGENERLVGRAIEGRRDEIVLATKGGRVRAEDGTFLGFNGRPEYLKQACEASLRRLNVDYVDLYQLHRVDPLTPVEESISALQELVDEGKARAVGLSETLVSDIARAAAVAGVVSVQSEYSVFTREVEDNGVLAECAARGIGIVAYSPLGRGLLGGGISASTVFPPGDNRGKYERAHGENLQHNLSLVDVLRRIGTAHRATPAQVALAWLLARSSETVPLFGARSLVHLEENARATELTLDCKELDELDALPEPAGDRYPGGQTPVWTSPPRVEA
jgi:aryl-alcohol dehydrogenase-like predicted oxidoreductase